MIIVILLPFFLLILTGKACGQACTKNCGDGTCEVTTHPDPNFRMACRCRDGRYQFDACQSQQSKIVNS